MRSKATYGHQLCSGISSFTLVLLLVMIQASASAQHRLTVNLVAGTDPHMNDSFYVAGNFNGWQPADGRYRLENTGKKFVLIIDSLAAGEYQFKFTRGKWTNCEVYANGAFRDNRVIRLNADTIIDCIAEAWADEFTAVKKVSTAASNVLIMDTAFFMPQLNRSRKVWIYLPPGYAGSKKRYPVIYMHDGQNLFNDSTAFREEWGIDECMDSLAAKGKRTAIVVGIENSGHRMTEYSPYPWEGYENAEGEEYVSFIAQTLKPYVDKHFRTIAAKENTIIAGSSLGALISYYAALRYPGVFGKCGVFSPAFQIAPGIVNATDSLAGRMTGQFFFYTGGMESGSMLPGTMTVADKLGEQSGALIYFVNDPAGKHEEKAWRKWFGEFCVWILGNGLDQQMRTGD